MSGDQMKLPVAKLTSFLRESNAQESIEIPITLDVLDAAQSFLELGYVGIADLSNIVNIFQPGAALRILLGQDVGIQGGDLKPPAGGLGIRDALARLLYSINDTGDVDNPNSISPYTAHQLYTRLHPYTDGNGRSGRLLWLWQHLKEGTYHHRGFHQQWYLESLEQWYE